MLQNSSPAGRTGPPPVRSTTVRRGTHAALSYSTADELRAIVGPYIAAGLEHGDRCVYILGDRSLVELVDGLDRAGIDVPKHSANGSLQIMRAQQVYLGPGRFHPGAVEEMVRGSLRSALGEGFLGLRAAGEMGWALSGTPLAELVDYELRIDRTLFIDRRLTGLCLYDDRRFGWEALAAIQAAHAGVLPPSRENGY